MDIKSFIAGLTKEQKIALAMVGAGLVLVILGLIFW